MAYIATVLAVITSPSFGGSSTVRIFIIIFFFLSFNFLIYFSSVALFAIICARLLCFLQSTFTFLKCAFLFSAPF